MSRHPQGNDLAGKLKVLFAFAVAVATCGAARAVADVDVAAAETGFGTGETDVSDGRWPHFSLHAAADIESAYICRGYVWDRRPYSAQSVDGTVGLGPFGRADVYLWSMSALSGEGHSTPMRRAYNEVDYGLRYFYDVAFVGQYGLVMDDARAAVKASSAREATRDLTYAGIGLELDF